MDQSTCIWILTQKNVMYFYLILKYQNSKTEKYLGKTIFFLSKYYSDDDPILIWEDNGSSSLNGEDVLKNQSTKIRGKIITQLRTKAPTLVWHCEIGSIIPQRSQV